MPSNRRNFLKHLAAGACLFAEPYRTLAQSLRKKVKITDVKCMIVRGTWDWNLIKIETDAGISGIGEAYWGPGVKDIVLNQMKPLVIGEDPLNVDKLYHKIFGEQISALTTDADHVLRAQYLLNVAHTLERIGDRVTNVAEDIVFLDRGEVVELD